MKLKFIVPVTVEAHVDKLDAKTRAEIAGAVQSIVQGGFSGLAHTGDLIDAMEVTVSKNAIHRELKLGVRIKP